MDLFSSTLAVLSAMITPAVLISASGTLILSTSTRLGRAVDRVRALTERLEELSRAEEEVALYEERRAAIFDQLDKLTRRLRLLQRCLTVFYLAVGLFVATSVAIGIVTISHTRYTWIPVVLGLIGACFLFYGSVMLIFEARLGLATLQSELDFIGLVVKHNAPEGLTPQPKRRWLSFGRVAD